MFNRTEDSMPATTTSVDEYLAGLPENQGSVLEHLPLDVIGESVARTTVDGYIRMYEAVKRK